jgi:uncharacterized membrane protein HdeD (DUF308 family)
MFGALSRNWWAVALRGLLAVLFGVVALLWPGLTLASLVLLWGVYAVVDGFFMLAAGILGGTDGPRWSLLAMGLVSVAAGVIAFVAPGITALALLFVIAAWAIVDGIFEIVAAIELRKVLAHEWLLGLAGLASIAFGVLMFVMPGAGALALLWAIGTFALVFGGLTIGLGMRLRGMRGQLPSGPALAH